MDPVSSTMDLDRGQLEERIARVRTGMSPGELRTIFGEDELESEKRGELVVHFWRVRVKDEDQPGAANEIYMGEFDAGRLVFGALLPRGT